MRKRTTVRASGRLTSKVKDGVIPVPAGARLANGAVVEIVPLAALRSDPPFLKAILKLSKPRKWADDFALNYAHYSKGLPKK